MSGDRPDARELIEAVAVWLAADLGPGLEGGDRFEAMVAAHGLMIAARELELAEQHATLDAAAFAPLLPNADPGGDLGRALAEAIAAGTFDDDLPTVAAVLREHIRRKLAIARPGYDDVAAP